MLSLPQLQRRTQLVELERRVGGGGGGGGMRGGEVGRG